MPVTDSFPRRSARTQRFTLGQPRAFSTDRDGRRVLFLRTRTGEDAVTCLWALDVTTGEERVLADPRALLADPGDEVLTDEERARRERLREGAGGIVAYATDDARATAAFALNSALWITDVTTGTTARAGSSVGVIDPRPSPDGRHVAFVSDGSLHVLTRDGRESRVVAGPDDGETDVTWGLAEFVAAEEMGRYRGFWWSPSSDALLVARVDESPVPLWHIADPANPDRPARANRYPAAGSADAHVSLWLVGLDGTRTEVGWDHDAFPYLASVSWPTDENRAYESERSAVIQLLSRSQQDAQVVQVREDGSTRLLRELHDDAWIDLVPGVPTWGEEGELLTVEPSEDTYRLCVDGRPVTPPGLQVRALLDVGRLADDEPRALVAASPDEDPTTRGVLEVWHDDVSWHAGRAAGGDGWSRESPGPTPAGITSWADGVLVSTGWDAPSTAVFAHRTGVRTIRSFAADPGVAPRPHVLRSPGRDVVTAVFLPAGHVPGSAKLPVLMSPYGGPHAQRVLAARNAHLESQWLADQGFAVVVADGRGTPRTPSWERAVRFDLAGPVLDDQVEALHAAAAAFPDLDLGRVGIRGWSFGGYLAALAVLRRPDVFHAAVAGAPVTDWALYDTVYTERYLGLPDENPGAYAQSSLLVDAARAVDAEHPVRPLLLIHGLADDNVVAAHTLRFSSALLAAGRPHTVLPLSGVTHMTPQEVVAENLLLLQLQFLNDALTTQSP